MQPIWCTFTKSVWPKSWTQLMIKTDSLATPRAPDGAKKKTCECYIWKYWGSFFTFTNLSKASLRSQVSLRLGFCLLPPSPRLCRSFSRCWLTGGVQTSATSVQMQWLCQNIRFHHLKSFNLIICNFLALEKLCHQRYLLRISELVLAQNQRDDQSQILSIILSIRSISHLGLYFLGKRNQLPVQISSLSILDCHCHLVSLFDVASHMVEICEAPHGSWRHDPCLSPVHR